MARNSQKRGTKETPFESVHFLIVDDHTLVRRMISQHLKSCNMTRFSFSQDGNDAIQVLKRLASATNNSSPPDRKHSQPDVAKSLPAENDALKASHAHCVITDFGMSGSNGLHVLKAIRCGETSVPRDTPVILLTGYSDDYIISTALQLDVSAFVLKPVSRNGLWERVARVLKVATPVKDASAYAMVEIPDEGDHGFGRRLKSANRNSVDSDDDKEMRSIPLSAIQPGAVLAADLYGESGALLLREGSVFSKSILQKLLDVDRMGGLSRNVPIKIRRPLSLNPSDELGMRSLGPVRAGDDEPGSDLGVDAANELARYALVEN